MSVSERIHSITNEYINYTQYLHQYYEMWQQSVEAAQLDSDAGLILSS